MEFEFTKEQQDFRQEVREFCQKEPWGEIAPEEIDPVTYSPSFYQKVVDKGWIGLQIPKEYGGQGKSTIYEAIFEDEMAYSFAPIGTIYPLTTMVSNIILECGTECQKREYLPRIVKNEISVGQAFTEPEAGSDLASVKTRAVRKGDCYLVNGQKIFNSSIHNIQNGYSMLMARTDPSSPLEKGISLFVLDNRTPGISCTPIRVLSGTRTNQVFLDNVKIPRENLIGEENCGWDYFMQTKPYYWHKVRALMLGSQQRTFDELVGYLRETESNGHPLSKKPAVRQKIAEMTIDLKILRLLTYRLAWMLSEGLDASDCSTKLKVIGDDIALRFGNEAMQIMGLSGQLAEGASYAPLSGMMEAGYRFSCVFHFVDSGGVTTAKNFLATHGLGLPEI